MTTKEFSGIKEGQPLLWEYYDYHQGFRILAYIEIRKLLPLNIEVLLFKSVNGKLYGCG